VNAEMEIRQDMEFHRSSFMSAPRPGRRASGAPRIAKLRLFSRRLARYQ